LSRNNDERIGARQGASTAPVGSSDVFSFSTPTEFVDLPTGGKYYPEDHPLHGKEQVEIRFMTAKDEDILSSKTLLKKGLAIERFLQNVIIDKSINTDTLYIGDKNAILVAARKTGYGERYSTRTTCPSCLTVSDYEFNLSNLGTYYGDDWEGYDIQSRDDRIFAVTVPQSKVEVEVQLLTSKDEQYLARLTASKKKKNLPETGLTDQFRMLIVSVNGHRDSKSIQNFVEGMPARDSRYLRTAYEKVVPNVDMKQLFSCSSCDFEQEVVVPFTANFFWPKR
jgi:hypothetical protein